MMWLRAQFKGFVFACTADTCFGQAGKATVVLTDKTFATSIDKISAVSADRTAAVSQDISMVSTTQGLRPCVVDRIEMSWEILSADTTDILSADTTNVLSADTTDVLSARKAQDATKSKPCGCPMATFSFFLPSSSWSA